MTATSPADPELARPLTSAGSRVLLVGTGTHLAGSELPDLAAVRRSVEDLAATLITRCGVPEANVLPPVIDPASPMELGAAVTRAAAEAGDVLLVYFAGHGLVGDDRKLYLATSATDSRSEGLSFKALPYDAIPDVLRGGNRSAVVVILDCCFSGRATSPLAPPAVAAAIEQAHVRGGFLLAAAARDEYALAPAGHRYTAFTGELIRLLTEGDPAGPRELTLGHISRYLARAMPRHGLPRPHTQATGHAGNLVIAANQAYRGLPSPPPVIADSDAGAVCPYRGLDPFEPEDARFFFGREQLVTDLAARLTSGAPGGIIAVVGASGSGKTSLLRAGLVPALEPARMRVARMTPGRLPVDALAEALAACASGDPNRFAMALRGSPDDMSALVASLDEPGWVLVADQFEELFTACEDDGERRDFIRALTAVTGALGGVVIGVRADFYGACTAYPQLVAALEGRQLVVGPMTDDQLRATIEKPAQVAGLALQHGLADVLLRDLRVKRGGLAGALPLLSHALRATWHRRTSKLMTIADYEATGGIGEAIARTAEQAYASLDPPERDAARLLLLRLIRIGDSTEDVGRRLPLGELVEPGPLDTTRRALDALARHRLVVIADGTVTIVHEALLSAWPRLRSWIETDRTGLLVRQQVTDAARAWQAEGRDPDGLYRGARLTTASALADDEEHGPLEPIAREFLDASMAARRRDQVAASRRKRRRRTLIGSIGVLAGAAMIASAVAVRLGHDSAASIARTRSEQLAADANAVRSTNPGLASQLAVAAYREANTTEARSSLLTSLTGLENVTAATLGKPVIRIAASPAGNTVAVATTDHAVQLWNLATTRPVLEATIHTRNVTPAFVPGGRLLAVGCTRAGLCLWNIANTRHPILVAALPGAPISSYSAVTVSSDGTLLAATTAHGVTRVWNIAAPRHPQLLTTLPITPRPGALSDAAFQPGTSGGTVLATTLAGDATRLWDMSHPAHPRLLSTIRTGYDTLAFSPDGSELAGVRAVVGLGVWDVSKLNRPTQVKTPSSLISALQQGPLAVSFSPDGNTLAVGGVSPDGGRTGTLMLLDQKSQSETSFIVNSTIESLAYEPGGMLVIGEDRGTVSLWGRPMPELPANSVTQCEDECAFSPNGDLLLLPAPQFGRVDLWDVSHPGYPRLDAVLPTDLDSARFLSDTVVVVTGVVTGTVAHAASAVSVPAALWDVRDPRHPRTGTILGGGAIDAAVSANAAGDLVAVPGEDGVLRLWHVADAYHATLLGRIPDPQPSSGPGGDAALTPDGHTVFVSSTTGFRLWDVSDPRHPVPGDSETLAKSDQPYTIDYQSDGTDSMLSAEDEPSHRLWAVANGHVDATHLLTGPQPLLGSASFSTDGRLLAATGLDGALMLWDTSNPTQPRNLGASLTPAAFTSHFAISADDTLLAGAGYTSLQLWDISNPYLPTPAATADVDVDNLAFAQRGHLLAVHVASSNVDVGEVYLLDTDPAAAAAQLCAFTGDTITRAQWARYEPGVPYQPPCP